MYKRKNLEERKESEQTNCMQKNIENDSFIHINIPNCVCGDVQPEISKILFAHHQKLFKL